MGTGEDLQAVLTELIGGLPLSQVCFGLGSELCFSCRFSRPMSGKRLTHDALRFLAEDQLPISAEDFTCVLQADGEDVCCLAAERHVVQAAAAVTRGRPL